MWTERLAAAARQYRDGKKPWPAVDFKPMLAVLRELKRSNAT